MRQPKASGRNRAWQPWRAQITTIDTSAQRDGSSFLVVIAYVDDALTVSVGEHAARCALSTQARGGSVRPRAPWGFAGGNHTGFLLAARGRLCLSPLQHRLAPLP